jgi:hypothetical protein
VFLSSSAPKSPFRKAGVGTVALYAPSTKRDWRYSSNDPK